MTVEAVWADIDVSGECLVKHTTGVCFTKICVSICNKHEHTHGRCAKIGSDKFKKCYCDKEGCDYHSSSEDSNTPPAAAPVDSPSDFDAPSGSLEDISPSDSPLY